MADTRPSKRKAKRHAHWWARHLPNCSHFMADYRVCAIDHFVGYPHRYPHVSYASDQSSTSGARESPSGASNGSSSAMYLFTITSLTRRTV